MSLGYKVKEKLNEYAERAGYYIDFINEDDDTKMVINQDCESDVIITAASDEPLFLSDFVDETRPLITLYGKTISFKEVDALATQLSEVVEFLRLLSVEGEKYEEMRNSSIYEKIDYDDEDEEEY